MENKIQELTDKIYHEGVEKGNEEANRLVENAKNEAKIITENAQKEADSIIKAAHKSSNEWADHTKSELKLFADQAVNALKTEITNMMAEKLVTEATKKFTQDKNDLNAFIVGLAAKWSVDEPIVISTSEADELKNYFMAHAKSLLDHGVTIEKVNGIKTLFTISPEDGSYKINFGDEEFMNYFKAFLRPQLVQILF